MYAKYIHSWRGWWGGNDIYPAQGAYRESLEVWGKTLEGVGLFEYGEKIFFLLNP